MNNRVRNKIIQRLREEFEVCDDCGCSFNPRINEHCPNCEHIDSQDNLW